MTARVFTPEQKQRRLETCAAWAARNEDRVLAARKKYTAANRVQLNEKRADRRKKNAAEEQAKARLYQRQKRGIIGATDEARSGPCPVCTFVGPLVLDHDKETGRIRGWLCNRCNRSLGQLGDTLAAARRLVSYLEASNVDLNDDN